MHSLLQPICLELIASPRRKCNNHRYVLVSSQTVSFNPELSELLNSCLILCLSLCLSRSLTLSLSHSLTHSLSAFVCARAHVSLSKDGLKFKTELYKHNETVSERLGMWN